MSDLGKLLFFLGLALAGLGLLLWSGLGRGWLGRLPGDIALELPSVENHELAGAALTIKHQWHIGDPEVLPAIVQLAASHLQGVEIDAVEARTGEGLRAES